MIVVTLLSLSLAAMCAQWMGVNVELWFVGWAIPTPSHFDDWAGLDEPNIMSMLWSEV